ncbi:MAG: endonuclease/exonuclease/phosphatase family protein [Odoribacter sp.]|nr:endonuclease/exonuclease/phosphatase family protein [Odoribacter sp.]
MKLIAIVVLVLCLLWGCKQEKEIKFLQLNIWQEGVMVKNGYEALADELARADADFVMLSEVRNYKGTRFCDRIVASLKERGKTYYSFYSYDSGLLSKYPIVDSAVIFPENGDHGSIYKLTADWEGKRVCVYTAHLDYRNCAYYRVRGYDGSTWEKMEPDTVVASLLADNVASQRDDAIRQFIADAEKETAQGHLVFIGGDFNEPSHLDWTEATKDSADHRGVVIPWTVSTMLTQAGYKDTYREMYPDPVKNPGYTYPADSKETEVSRLTWTPDADERERIDFIYYYPQKGLKLLQANVFGPRGSIRNSMRVQENTQDVFIEPLGVWPTDHKGVLVRFCY